MKITDIRETNNFNKEMDEMGFVEIFSVYGDKDGNKQAFCVSPEIDTTVILIALYRLGKVLSKSLNVPYDVLIDNLKSCDNFTERYGNLDLSEEQLQKMVDKELNPSSLRRQK